MKIGFVGAGKVGFTLGKFFSVNGFQVTGYYSKHFDSAREAALFTGTKAYDTLDALVCDSDTLFLTVPDGEISSVYSSVSKCGISEKIICHCSGAMSVAEAFFDLSRHGAYGYSIHPLFPISNKLEAYRELGGAFFVLEGDGRHIHMWQTLLQSLGVRVHVINGAEKSRYHAACAISSNLICALVEESVELLESCGFSRQLALEAITPLLRSNLEHIIEDGPVKALTGPVERCDTSTVKKHLACLPSLPERELYRYASHKLLTLAAAKNPGRDYSPLEKLLDEGEI